MKPEHQQQEHTASYYAATASEVTRYSLLEGSVSADVCVVGGGFTGVATALTLTERGYKVALLEANRIGWGASGRNGGQLICGGAGLARIKKKSASDMGDLLWAMKWRGNDIIRERVKKYAIACDLKDGYVEVATKPQHLEYIRSEADLRARRNFPYPTEVWDREQTRAMLGTDAYLGAFACFRDGHVHPLNLCIGEARAAAQQGAMLFEQSPVTAITHGKRPVVKTATGSVTADTVVLAGNAYSKLEPRYLSNLVFPASSYIVATEPLPEELASAINPRDVAVCDLNHIVDYFRLSADKRLLFGGTCIYSGREPRSIESFIKPRMLAIYPQLESLRIDYQWGGSIGIVLNRSLAVGRIHDNIYYCQGYSGHGVCPTHLMGEVMADAITGTMERFDLFADIGHFRIPGSQWFGNQLIALGMLYYRLKDRL
jgi:glycine/D-amino acid oxidase-like deaminating enzyme